MLTEPTTYSAYASPKMEVESDKPKTDKPKENTEKPKPQGVPKPGVIIRPVGD